MDSYHIAFGSQRQNEIVTAILPMLDGRPAQSTWSGMGKYMMYRMMILALMNRPLLFFRYAQYTSFMTIALPLFVYAPLFLVVIISFLTCVQVYASAQQSVGTRTKRQIMKEKQAVLQLTLIVISFVVGYGPYTGKQNTLTHMFFLSVSLILISHPEASEEGVFMLSVLC